MIIRCARSIARPARSDMGVSYQLPRSLPRRGAPAEARTRRMRAGTGGRSRQCLARRGGDVGRCLVGGLPDRSSDSCLPNTRRSSGDQEMAKRDKAKGERNAADGSSGRSRRRHAPPSLFALPPSAFAKATADKSPRLRRTRRRAGCCASTSPHAAATPRTFPATCPGLPSSSRPTTRRGA